MRFAPLVAVVLGVVIGSIARGAPPATAPMDRDAAMEPCTEHLKAIGKALAAYERDHGKLPDQLSDLFPKYVTDKTIFHCPADPTEGDPARDFAHRDQAM